MTKDNVTTLQPKSKAMTMEERDKQYNEAAKAQNETDKDKVKRHKFNQTDKPKAKTRLSLKQAMVKITNMEAAAIRHGVELKKAQGLADGYLKKNNNQVTQLEGLKTKLNAAKVELDYEKNGNGITKSKYQALADSLGRWINTAEAYQKYAKIWKWATIILAVYCVGVSVDLALRYIELYRLGL